MPEAIIYPIVGPQWKVDHAQEVCEKTVQLRVCKCNEGRENTDEHKKCILVPD